MKMILHVNEPVGKIHFHMNGFARRPVLTKGQNATRKLPISLPSIIIEFEMQYEKVYISKPKYTVATMIDAQACWAKRTNFSVDFSVEGVLFRLPHQRKSIQFGCQKKHLLCAQTGKYMSFTEGWAPGKCTGREDNSDRLV